MNLRRHPNITLRQLWHFVTAAEAGTISEAARLLHMAPSAISMSLTELDRLAGAQLCVKRKAHGLTLTSAGRVAYAQAKQMLDLAEEIVDLADEDLTKVRGPLTVGSYMPLAPAVIPHMLRRFAEVCPAVEVNFVEGYHDDLQDKLLSGEIDVAFMYDSGLGPDIRTLPLLSVMPYLLLSEGHALAEEVDLTIEDVADEPFILFNASPISTHVLELIRSAGHDPEIRHRSRSYATVRSLVGAGMGVSVLFQRPKLDLSYSGLRVVSKRIPLPGHIVPPHVALAWSRGLRPNARVSAWLEVAEQSFREEEGD